MNRLVLLWSGRKTNLGADSIYSVFLLRNEMDDLDAAELWMGFPCHSFRLNQSVHLLQVMNLLHI